MNNQDYFAELQMEQDMEAKNEAEIDGDLDGEVCPECKTNLSVETYTNDAGYLKSIGVCQFCGYTESD